MNKQSLMNFYIKYRLVIYPAVVAFSSLILIIFVIYPQLKDFFDGKNKISKERERIVNLEAKASDLEKVNQVEVEKSLKNALVALPQNQDFTSLVGIFQKLGAGSGITLVSLQLGSSQVQVPGASGFSVKLEVEGSSLALANLLKNIDQASRSMKVESVEVSKTQGGNLTGSVLVDVFYAPVPTQLGNLEQEAPKLSAEEEKILQELSISIPTLSTESSLSLPARGKPNPFE